MIPYTLYRAKRKTIAIYVKNGAVTVKAPMRTDIKIIEAFLINKHEWIEKKLRDLHAREVAYADVLSGKSFLYLGKRLRPMPTDRKSFALGDDVLFVPATYYGNDGVLLNDVVASMLKRLYKRQATVYLSARMREISAAIQLPYTKFSLTSAKTKWGSCDSCGHIRLNWHLMLLPKAWIDYVIVHELVHTIEHNHSSAFWQQVARFYPSYKEVIACLKKVGILIELYL